MTAAGHLGFFKMSGAGNDFVLVEASKLGPLADPSALAKRLCDRKRSVGGDGLLVVRRRAGKRPASLDYYNADGSRAFCANGSRCAAWFIHSQGWQGKEFTFESGEGPIEAVVTGEERVRIRMPQAREIHLGLKLAAAGGSWTVHSLNTGAPHAVVEIPAADLEAFRVEEVGRALRKHVAFYPAGTNVDFIAVQDGKVRVRTYERGVEAETLSCGTGVTAAAICAHRLKGTRSPITALTRGGDALVVRFKAGAGRYEDIWLEGPAAVTFTGEVPA